MDLQLLTVAMKASELNHLLEKNQFACVEMEATSPLHRLCQLFFCCDGKLLIKEYTSQKSFGKKTSLTTFVSSEIKQDVFLVLAKNL